MAEYPPAIGGQTKTPRELDLARRVFRISKHCTDDGQNEIRMPESGRAVNRIPSRRQPNRATMVRTWCSLSTAVTPAGARSKPPPCEPKARPERVGRAPREPSTRRCGAGSTSTYSPAAQPDGE